MKKTILLILLISGAFAGSGQHYNTWYFGSGAGISFNSMQNGVPQVLTDGVNAAYEGSAAYCDAAGQLLFYTNGARIFNRTHAIMLNGDSIMGHISAAQAGLIVPMPGNDSLLYVFTTDAVEHNLVYGYRYSIVNIRRDGGKGEVVTKNILFDPNCTERIGAVRHADGISVWVITNEKHSNVFKSWLVSCNGLSNTPVISAVGTIPEQDLGQIKVSPNGKLICQTTYPDLAGNSFQLFDFDNATGAISQARQISNSGASYLGCEFSPDSRLIYVSRASEPFVDQFECTLGSAALINASRVVLPARAGCYGIQTGPDRRIYLNSDRLTLSVISHPTIKGTGCSLEIDKIALGTRGGLGLPSAINDGPIDPNNAIFSQVIDSCNGRVQFSGQVALGGTLQWNWDFGDGTTSTANSPLHTFSPAGQTYLVKLRVTSASGCGFIELTKQIAPGGIFADAKFEIVPRCDSNYVRFVDQSIVYPDSAMVTYQWDFGDGQGASERFPVHSYANPGIYTVRLVISTGTACLDRAASRTLDLQVLDIQAGPDQTIDAGQSVQLNVTGGGTQFTWSPPKWLNDPHVANPLSTPQDDVVYTITATNDAGCRDIDSVRIHLNPVNGIYVPTAFSPDGNGLNDELKPIVGSGYQLQEFSVFNRWGQRLFLAKTSVQGWDGRLNGISQGIGSYVWYLKGKDPQGKAFEKKGTSILVR